MALKAFLSAANDALSDRSSPKQIHIVLSNESCDLDSTVSAITYAFFLRSTSTDSNTIYLPVLNIPREQYRLRLESAFLLGKCDLEPELLTFTSDFSLLELASMEGLTLSVTLVDHHVLKDGQEFLKDKVQEVLDHRPLAEDLPDSWHVEIEKVGSCCTLVARHMLDHPSFPLDPVTVQLLIGAILTDTGNLSITDKIATDTDHAVVMSLNSMLPDDISPRQIFEDIHNIKFDLSSLTVMEMLHKDLKVLRGSYIVVAMSTITMNLAEVLSRPEFSHDASAFSAALPADATIIMTLVTGDEGIVERCVAVYSASRVYRDQLTEVLLSSTSPNLGLQLMELPVRVEHVTAFVQTNLRVSRKGVIPLIRDFLAGEATLSPEDENVNASLMASSSEGDISENVDEGNMQMRHHINMAKTAQSNQIRTSLDQFDLAAVGTDALISPSLSSDSDPGTKSHEDNVEDDSQRSSEVESRHVETAIERVPPGVSETSPSSTSNSSLLSSLMAKQEEEEAKQSTSPPADPPNPSNCDNQDSEPACPMNQIETTNGPVDDSEDVLGMHSPFEFLCPSTDYPLELLSLPASGQISGQESGQGSKVPSYPETPPNSYVMSPVGPGFCKQTQLPSFNSKEMVEKIQQKKRALSNRRRRGTDEDGVDDIDVAISNRSDGLDFFNVLTVNEGGLDSSGSGGGRSRGGGSLISPAVPQNSYVDLVGTFGQSSNYDIPALARADIEEKVIEKRSQFEWDGGVPYTPQNSYAEGGAGALTMGSLTSFNSAEMVARIRAKQAAMFVSSGRASGSSEDSLGCHSPDGVQRSRGISLESPAQAYTPQNSYKDGLGILDSRGRLPDLNEVAERLSTEKFNHGKSNRRSASNSGCGSRDEDGPGPAGGLQKPGGRHSSSQSDSQNTMSDVESLMSVSTDFGTPSDNVVASTIAGSMRADMMTLSRKDTGDSEVFTPGRPDDKPKVAFGFVTTDVIGVAYVDDNQNGDHEAMTHNGDIGNGSATFSSQAGELFSPLDDKNMMEEEVQYFQAAENIVAKSIAAAIQINHDHPLENGDISMSSLSLANQADCRNNGPLDSRNEDDQREEEARDDHSSKVPLPVTDFSPAMVAATSSSDKSLSDISTDVSSLSQELSVRKVTDSQIGEGHRSSKSLLKTQSVKNRNGKDSGVSFADKEVSDHDEKMREAALSELAYEWAHDLIQGVLEDFNLAQGLEQESPRANCMEDTGSEDLESRGSLCNYNDISEPVSTNNNSNTAAYQRPKEGVVDWSKAGKDGGVSDLSIVITSGDDNQMGNNSDIDDDVDGFSVEALDGSVGDFVRDDTVDVDEDDECIDKEEEKVRQEVEEESREGAMGLRESRPSIPTLDDHSPQGKSNSDLYQAEWKLSRGSSSSTDSAHKSERKWSRETDKSMTIMEDEMLTNFPERKSMGEDHSLAEDDEEPITSFPGRKISLSEEYPRRFSRDDDMSRRSSKIEGEELNHDSEARPHDLETDYLPNMDPFQGSLDIIANETSISKITDVDREVVEGESFRRVSGHELDSGMKEHIDEGKESIDIKAETAEGDSFAQINEVSKMQIEVGEKGLEKAEEMFERENAFRSQSLPTQPSPSIPRKKRIRVSFSEEVMEENGTSYQISPRTALRSPPPPLTEHHQTMRDGSLASTSRSSGNDDTFDSNPTKIDGAPFYEEGREVYFTTTGRVSIPSEGEEDDSAFRSPSDQLPYVTEDPVYEQARAQVDNIMASISETVRQAEVSMRKPRNEKSDNHSTSSAPHFNSSFFPDPSTDPMTPKQTKVQDQTINQNPFSLTTTPYPSTGPSHPTVSIPVPAVLHPLQDETPLNSVTSMGSVKEAEYQDEWQDDNIQDVAQQAGVNTTITDNVRKKIHADSSLVPGLEEDDDEDEEDINAHDCDSDIGDLEWERRKLLEKSKDDTPILPADVGSVSTATFGKVGSSQSPPPPRFRRVVTSGSTFDVDMELVAPYKSVLSHGGYFDEGLSAVIVFYGYNLPSRRQQDYHFIMKHLFHYVVHELEELVAEDYVIVYFHGSTPRRKMPGLGWLRRCYQCIDRSSKFSSKLKFVRDLDELHHLVPLDNITMPDAILHYNLYRQHLLTPPPSPTPSYSGPPS